MATDTVIAPVQNGAAAQRGTTGPPESRPPSGLRRPALTWVAIIAAGIAVAALAVATFTDGGDTVDIPVTRFDPQAEQYERDARLEGQARTHRRDGGPETQASPSSSATRSDHDALRPGSRRVLTS